MNDLVVQMLGYLAGLGLASPPEPPVIKLEPPEFFVEYWHSPSTVIFGHGGCLNGVVYLGTNVDLTTIEGRSVLVHELAHYVNNRCLPLTEFAYFVSEEFAYAIQNRYLSDNGSRKRVTNPYTGNRTEYQSLPTYKSCGLGGCENKGKR